MITNDRAELADAIAIGLEYTHSAAASTTRRYGGGAFAEIHGVFDLGGIADHLIELGWRKVGADTDTHTEYGVRRPEKYGSTVAWVGGRRPAESLAEAWGDGSVVVSRTVTVGPWEVEQ